MTSNLCDSGADAPCAMRDGDNLLFFLRHMKVNRMPTHPRYEVAVVGAHPVPTSRAAACLAYLGFKARCMSSIAHLADRPSPYRLVVLAIDADPNTHAKAVFEAVGHVRMLCGRSTAILAPLEVDTLMHAPASLDLSLVDFIAKPYSARELTFRASFLLRRADAVAPAYRNVK